MINICLIMNIFLRVLIPAFFVSEAYADWTEDYPEWENDSGRLNLLATGSDSGRIEGVQIGHFIMIFDNDEHPFPDNGSNPSGFTVTAEDPCLSENGYLLTGIGPGFSVEVYPDSEAVSCQDADIFRWRDVFLPCDISAEADSFSVSPSSALGESSSGSVSLTPETAGENSYLLEVITEAGELLSGVNTVGGLAPGTYKVRVAPQDNILASAWFEFTVEGPSVVPIEIEDVSAEMGSIEVFHIIPGISPYEVQLLSGDELVAGEKVYVSVTAEEGYEVSGLDVAAENGVSTRLLPEEAENGVFSFLMPEYPITVKAVIVPVQEQDPSPGEEGEEDPSDDEDDETPEDPDKEDENPEKYVTEVVFFPDKNTVLLSEGKQLYYYTVAPEDADGTLVWSCDDSSVADVKLDPVQKMILITPKAEGTFTLKAVLKENTAVSWNLIIDVIDDRAEFPVDFESCSFTYATEEGIWFYDLPADFSLRCSGSGAMLDYILMDGMIVPQYSNGSLNWSLFNTEDTSLTFSERFMASLPHGSHAVTFVYTNGVSASRPIYIQSRYSPPKTGDSSDISFFCGMMALSVAAAAAGFRKIRKEKS